MTSISVYSLSSSLRQIKYLVYNFRVNQAWFAENSIQFKTTMNINLVFSPQTSFYKNWKKCKYRNIKLQRFKCFTLKSIKSFDEILLNRIRKNSEFFTKRNIIFYSIVKYWQMFWIFISFSFDSMLSFKYKNQILFLDKNEWNIRFKRIMFLRICIMGICIKCQTLWVYDWDSVSIVTYCEVMLTFDIKIINNVLLLMSFDI